MERCPHCNKKGVYYSAPRHGKRCRYCGRMVTKKTPPPPEEPEPGSDAPLPLPPSLPPPSPHKYKPLAAFGPLDPPNPSRKTAMDDLPFQRKHVVFGIIAILLVIFCSCSFGYNSPGERTVYTPLFGEMQVKFEPGFYANWFGPVETYKDFVTFDFTQTESEEDVTLDRPGIAVWFNDGGKGTVYGKVRLKLPDDVETMLAMHLAFRSHRGVAIKTIEPVVTEAVFASAGLMSSEAAYAEGRGDLARWVRQQISSGLFQTEVVTETIGGDGGEVDPPDQDPNTTERLIQRPIRRILYDAAGAPLQFESDFVTYGIRVDGFQLVDLSFEPRTMQQINEKREATMAIITARAEAERAQQDLITAEAEGRANVMVAQYEEEIIKKRSEVQAERDAAVAQIAAEQRVAVAQQAALEAQQLRDAAEFYKEEQILRGEGDAEYRRQLLEADGALEAKLEAYVAVMEAAFAAVGQQQWVPELWIQNGEGADGNQAMSLIDLLTAKVLQDLGLDLSTEIPERPAEDPAPADPDPEE